VLSQLRLGHLNESSIEEVLALSSLVVKKSVLWQR